MALTDEDGVSTFAFELAAGRAAAFTNTEVEERLPHILNAYIPGFASDDLLD